MCNQKCGTISTEFKSNPFHTHTHPHAHVSRYTCHMLTHTLSLCSVFRNGDVLSPAMRFIIPRSVLKNLEQILSLVSEKAMLRTGAVRR